MAAIGSDLGISFSPITTDEEDSTFEDPLPNSSDSSEIVTHLRNINTANESFSQVPILINVSGTPSSDISDNSTAQERSIRMDPIIAENNTEVNSSDRSMNESIHEISTSPIETTSGNIASSADAGTQISIKTGPLEELNRSLHIDDSKKNITEGKSDETTERQSEKKTIYRRYPSLQYIAYKAKLEINRQIKASRLRHAAERREDTEKYRRFKRTHSESPQSNDYMSTELRALLKNWFKGWF
ncbi:Hypothetical protein NTJ_02117 [Nesidiocoris tenuis]|uniref:Uncharacterized protein n=1 Tax=Nesidiocoris tenuis TaxID=355587 RepID=A0ABN7AEM7_9HEMI|nr:Hypothetical protein NTJ_02117 [Nesidiocoris tenuis]